MAAMTFQSNQTSPRASVSAAHEPDLLDLVPGYSIIAKSALVISGVVFALLGVGHLFLLPEGLRELMFTCALLSSTMLIGARVAVQWGKLPLSYLRFVPLFVVVTAWLNTSLHLVASGDPMQTTNLAIVLVCAGIILFSRLEFLLVATGCFAAWALAENVTTIVGGSWLHYGVHLGQALVISGTTFFWKRHVLIRNYQLRQEQYKARAAEHRSLLSAHAKAIEAEKSFRRALQADASKSMFLANMSHELRTPLNSVVGFAQLLKDRSEIARNPALVSEYAECIHGSGTQLLALINQILDFSRANAGVIKLAESQIDVYATLREILKQMSVLATESGVSLHLPETSGRILLLGDDLRIRQVLTNVISNAIKFTRSGGRIDVAASVQHDGVRITVRDTGIGIAVQDLAHIFEPFIQAESGLSKSPQGTGLGLAISKRLVELHDGTIELKSVLDEGTTVTIQFPSSRTISVQTKKTA